MELISSDNGNSGNNGNNGNNDGDKTGENGEIKDLIVQMRNIIERYNEGTQGFGPSLTKNFDVVTGRNIPSVSSYFTGNRDDILTFGNPSTFQYGLMSLKETSRERKDDSDVKNVSTP